MGNDDDFRTRVCSAGDDMGEDLWPMPLPPAYRKALDTEVADIAHKAGPAGGMLTAGLFLKEFVPEVGGDRRLTPTRPVTRMDGARSRW